MNFRNSTTWFLSLAVILLTPALSIAEVNQAEQIAPDVYFHEGDIKTSGHCNNGWIVFEDYVLVVDGNFPGGAQELIPKIKAVTDKPIRFVFDTHHHGDHAYGNQVWVDNGAVPVAHAGVIDELKKYETGYYGGQPGRWEAAAKSRKDVAASKLKLPTLLYNKDLIFDDGKHRVELLYFGVAHTHGDGFAWLPKEKILFTGDACLNGPYNYMADGDSAQWVKALAAAKKLGAQTICPAHGPVGTAQVLEDQQRFLVELRKQVKKYAGRKPEAVKAAVADIKAALLKQKAIARFVGDFLPGQVEQVYIEMGGKPFQPKTAAVDDPKQHAHDHGRELVRAK